jgi:hypothetical protein
MPVTEKEAKAYLGKAIRRPADWCCNEATSAASDHDEEVAEFHVTIVGAVNNSRSKSGTL